LARRNAPPRARLEWAYFLDVDGTLIDIARTPDEASVDEFLLELIERLHLASGGAIALVSGRALSDIQNRLQGLRVPVAGQHGLERRDAAGRLWIHAAPPAAKAVIRAALVPILDRHPELLLEDKGLTVALHYRRAPHLGSYVRRLVRALIGKTDAGLEMQCGKCVAEVKPSGVDKGTAVAEYLTEVPFRDRRPVYIGDDLNDERGFSEVNRMGGISIKVGKGHSCARYRLPDVAGVRQWLRDALELQP
jgi:trehalose 6-phosphate phosphatase